MTKEEKRRLWLKEQVQCRASGVLIYTVHNASFNSDPDWDNAPRCDGSGIGLGTDGCVKSRYRSLFVDHDSPCFVSAMKMMEDLQLDPERYHIFESVTKGYFEIREKEKVPLSGVAAKKKVLAEFATDSKGVYNRFHDLRLFGCMALDGDVKDSPRYTRSGCVTIATSSSVLPIVQLNHTVTRKAPLRDSLLESGAGDIGPNAKKMVQRAVYFATVSMNPHMARYTYTTNEDLEVFKRCMKYIFKVTESVIRPGGSIHIKHFWWAEHTNALGSFNEEEFLAKLRPTSVGQPTGNDWLDSYRFPTPQEVDLRHTTGELKGQPVEVIDLLTYGD